MNNIRHNIFKHLTESKHVLNKLIQRLEEDTILEEVCNLCTTAYMSGNKILIAGNGGSAADAQHFAGELVSSFYFERPALPAIALTTDSSVLTAIANDSSYEEIFARQIQAHGKSGDIFVVISTSGNSKNLLKAVSTCKDLGVKVVALTGETGGELKKIVDFCIRVPSNSTPRIQECHIIIEHIICSHIESSIFSKGES
jgi:D-sedoheptulose 7-phosphate isomerase